MKKILVAATNYGVWAEELQAPWDRLRKAGHQLTLTTPQGKKPLPLAISVDPGFMDPMQNYQVNPPEVCERTMELVNGEEWANPIKFSDADMKDYDGIVLAGGLGAMLDLANSPALHKLILDAYYSDKLIGSICYAVAALVFTRDPKNGYKSIINGKNVTAHPRAWDFDFDLTYGLENPTKDNAGTDVVTPGFLFPLEDLVTDAVGPKGQCISPADANRTKPSVAVDWPFVTGLSVESSIAFGEKLVEVLAGREVLAAR
ncbi:MAG TPA: thiamine biosynthesis protein ThiJ [Cyanobacteria bacterium UBA8530]|nr:thiamine biosynthesis protein ThiJ [Cyanobacteria bacterium UBA8530]